MQHPFALPYYQIGKVEGKTCLGRRNRGHETRSKERLRLLNKRVPLVAIDRAPAAARQYTAADPVLTSSPLPPPPTPRCFVLTAAKAAPTPASLDGFVFANARTWCVSFCLAVFVLGQNNGERKQEEENGSSSLLLFTRSNYRNR